MSCIHMEYFSALLVPLSITSRFTPFGAPSSHAALDLWTGVGRSPSMDKLRGKKGKKLQQTKNKKNKGINTWEEGI